MAENIIERLRKKAERFPQQQVWKQLLPYCPGAPREWICATNQDLFINAQKIAAQLQSLGVRKGDKVAILSNTRPEWLESDLAILMLGAVSVAVYQTLTHSEIGYILYDSGARIVFAENQEQADKLNILHNEAIIIPEVENRPEQKVQVVIDHVVFFEDAECEIKSVSLPEIKSRPMSVEFSTPEIKPEDLATLVYTSGTTGPAKGVMQTHGNHLANIRQVENSGITAGTPDILLILPLAHSFARLMAYLGAISDCRLIFPAISDKRSSKFNAASVTRDMCAANANIIPIVPRILEKIKINVEERSSGKGILPALLSIALCASGSCHRGKGNFIQKTIYALTWFVRSGIKKKVFGDNLWFLVSGGARLHPSINEFFESIGISVLQGYGLTETCVATNINPPGENRIGTVGPVLDKSIEVKIAEDGEILFRGPNNSIGYLNRPQATVEVWKADGWLATGDLGELSSDGYLTITGRKKDLIVNSYGKKIQPQDIESRLMQLPFVNQAVLIGNDRKFCSAVLTLDYEAVALHYPDLNLSDPGWYKNPYIRADLQKNLESLNETLASYEAIKKFLIVNDSFTVENGFLTPTFKIKRGLVEKKYLSEIEKLYG